VLDAERSGRPSNLNDKRLMDIFDSRPVSRLVDITSSTFYKCTATVDFISDIHATN
jgi:hypothetical protein